VDIDPEAVFHARRCVADSRIDNCRFEWSQDGYLPFPDRSFDAAFSTNTFEHVSNLDQAFNEILRVLRPGGSLLTRFGPLFYSPHGYHLYWACHGAVHICFLDFKLLLKCVPDEAVRTCMCHPGKI